MANELLPCPFCGNEPELNAPLSDPNTEIWCHHEDCPVRPYVDGPTPEIAIARWNSRAPAAHKVPLEVLDAIDKLWMATNLYRVLRQARKRPTHDLVKALDTCQAWLDEQSSYWPQPEPNSDGEQT